MGRRNKRRRTGDSIRHTSGLDPGSENHQSVLSERSRARGPALHHTSSKLAFLGRAPCEDLSGVIHEPDNRHLMVKAVVDLSNAEENRRDLWFACPSCSDFQFALAENALKFYQQKKQDAFGFELVKVWGAYFRSTQYPRRSPNLKVKCHISFVAKAKNNGHDESEKWFFAEVQELDDKEFVPCHVEILDPYDDGIHYGCTFCPPHVLYLHPSGFGGNKTEGFGKMDATSFFHYHKFEDERKRWRST